MGEQEDLPTPMLMSPYPAERSFCPAPLVSEVNRIDSQLRRAFNLCLKMPVITLLYFCYEELPTCCPG